MNGLLIGDFSFKIKTNAFIVSKKHLKIGML